MAKKYRATRNVEIMLDGNSIEIEADLEFTIEPSTPAYFDPRFGGEPPSGGYCDDIRCKSITLSGKSVDCPKWLSDWIAKVSDDASLYGEAMEQDKGDADRAADDRLEMAREDREYWPAHDTEID